MKTTSQPFHLIPTAKDQADSPQVHGDALEQLAFYLDEELAKLESKLKDFITLNSIRRNTKAERQR